MGHYVDIHLRQEPELPAHQLLAALYTKLHRVLAQTGATTVGVSFPEYSDNPPASGRPFG